MHGQVHWNTHNSITVEFDDGIILTASPIDDDIRHAADEVVRDGGRISDRFLLVLIGAMPSGLPCYPVSVPEGAGLRIEAMHPRRTVRLRHRALSFQELENWAKETLLTARA
jgi:hypothetical protein